MKEVFRVCIIGLAIGSFLWSCQSSKQVPAKAPEDSTPADTIDYTLVYLIHGDAGYLYHDEEGQGKQADEEAVREAISVAQEARNGEVLIFHQRPEKKVFWLFPKKDRLFYYYKNGEMVHRQKYSPQSSKRSFKVEANLFNEYRSKNSKRQFLLYFGHEIPSQHIGYHHSRSQSAFNTDTFAEGVGSFLSGKDKFDLTVLSTCDNGTPDMASRMARHSNYLLASPKNLHLSHIDSDSLLKLDGNPDISELKLAQSVAKATYQRLDNFIQTAVTLSVYNLQQEEQRIGALKEAYSKYKSNTSSTIEAENKDCATLSFWKNSDAPQVNTVFYKPPRFGQKVTGGTFSGWGCEE